MSRNGKHGHAGAIAIEQTIDQMQIPGPAASSAHCKFVSQMRFGTGRERRYLLMTNVDPLNLRLATNGISQAVKAVSDDAINSLYTRRNKRFNKLISNSLHVRTLKEILCSLQHTRVVSYASNFLVQQYPINL